MTRRSSVLLVALMGAAQLSSAAQAAVYTFTGGGGISPQPDSNSTTSGWMTEHRQSQPGLQLATVLDNGVVSLVPGNWLDQFGSPFDATYSGSVTVTNGIVTAGTLAWTGKIGFEDGLAAGFPGLGNYALAITNGSYNLVTGAYTGALSCRAYPAGLFPAACVHNFYPSAMQLPLGTLSFTDNLNGTVTLLMGSDAFTLNGGVKDSPPGAGNGSIGYNHRVRWTLNATLVQDADGDGVVDGSDNCLSVPNPGQADNDSDSRGNACDNCRDRANNTSPNAQCDSDSDGFGNRCDGDFNNNGFTNSQDTPLYRAQLGQPSAAPTYNKADINCNGFVNSQDTPLYRQLLGSPPGPSGLVP